MSRRAIHRMLIGWAAFMLFFTGCRMCQMPNPYSSPTSTCGSGSSGGFLHRAGSLYSDGAMTTGVTDTCTECQAGGSPSHASRTPTPAGSPSRRNFRHASRSSHGSAPFTREELMRGERDAVDAKIISVEEGVPRSSR
jgi:hypothetical protein